MLSLTQGTREWDFKDVCGLLSTLLDNVTLFPKCLYQFRCMPEVYDYSIYIDN